MSDQERMATRLRNLMAQVLDLSPDEIGPALSTDTASAWTSLNHLMLISQIENEFGVVFSNQELQQLTSYPAIVATLERRLSSSAG
jgi:acyl carrier protein